MLPPLASPSVYRVMGRRLNRQERDEHEAGAPNKAEGCPDFELLVSKYLLLLAVGLSPASWCIACGQGGSKIGKQMPADFQVMQWSAGEQDLLLKWLHPAPATEFHEIL